MDEVSKSETSETLKKGEKDLTAVLSYLGILFLVPLLICKDNAFAQFHAKQGLVLFIAEIATAVIAWIPILGWIVGIVCWTIWGILSLIGIINVLGGKQTPLPIIGKFAEKFKFQNRNFIGFLWMATSLNMGYTGITAVCHSKPGLRGVYSAGVNAEEDLIPLWESLIS